MLVVDSSNSRQPWPYTEPQPATTQIALFQRKTLHTYRDCLTRLSKMFLVLKISSVLLMKKAVTLIF
jgi:hypothetical protein